MIQPVQSPVRSLDSTFAKYVDACQNLAEMDVSRSLKSAFYLSKYFRYSLNTIGGKKIRRHDFCAGSADVAHGAFLKASPVIEFLGKVVGRKLIPGENPMLTPSEVERVGPA
jgi:hypothetical protein